MNVSLWNCTKGAIPPNDGKDWFWELCLSKNKGHKGATGILITFFLCQILDQPKFIDVSSLNDVSILVQTVHRVQPLWLYQTVLFEAFY